MGQILQDIKENMAKVIIGKEDVMDDLLIVLLADGHVLLEDTPGTGKTMLARSLAKSIDMNFKRIQFTPDLLPSDVTGISYYDRKEGEFIFREGPVFTNVLLADEINRATPRTQSSLLECMAEGQVSVDGETYSLAQPFFVIATENPVETLGCYPLPEAQLDRFLMKVSMGQMKAAEERQMIDTYIKREPLEEIRPVCTAEDICILKKQCRDVFVHEELRDYMVSVVQATRTANDYGGVSPRGTLALLRASQAAAMLDDRDFVVPEDIKRVAVPVLAHRMIGAYSEEREKTERIEYILNTQKVPTEDWSRR